MDIDIFMLVIHESRATEFRIGINLDDHRRFFLFFFFALLKDQRERPKKFRPGRGFEP